MFRFLLLLLPLTLLTACGGGGGGGSTNPPEAPTATLTATPVKGLQFTWTDVPTADSYKLLEDPDGVSGFTQVGSDVAAGVETLTHIIPLYARVNARYILQSCNSGGCADSNPISLSNAIVNDAIGYFKASNSDGDDLFGTAVSVSADGTTLAVGAPGESSNAQGINGDQNNELASQSGAVYLFRFDGSNWSQQAYIKASNAEAGDLFGSALSLSADGNTLAVGAPLEDSDATTINGSESNSATQSVFGAAYVFRFVNNTWSQEAYVKANNAGAQDQFGFAISLSNDGNTLAVGAFGEQSSSTGINSTSDNANGFSGAAYVFRYANGNWSQDAYIKASNTGNNHFFGYSLSLSGDGNTLAVGAYGEASAATGINGNQNDISASNSGAIYIFDYSNSSWSQQAYVKASNTEASDYFGYSVSISDNGNTLAVGAYGEDSVATGINGSETNGANSSGAVYIFEYLNNSWSQLAYVKASDTAGSDYFGFSISLSPDGNALAVGAYLEDSDATGINGDEVNNLSSASGSVYMFDYSSGSWMQQAYLKASNTDTTDFFGYSVSLGNNGDILAASSRQEASNATGINGDQNDNSQFKSGAVYLY